MGFQEHNTLVLLPVWGNEACRQRKPWGLLAGIGYQEPGQLMQSQEKQACGLLSSGAWLPPWASGRAVQWLNSTGNHGCWLTPSVTHGAVGAISPTDTEVPVSLAFQGEGSRSCSSGEHVAPSSCVCQEAWLTAERQIHGTWSQLKISVVGDQECWTVSSSSHSCCG
jgi:hypothetical protein